MTKRRIGLDERAEIVYSAMLRRPRWRVADLASALGWPAQEVRRISDRLAAERLVTTSYDDARCVRAVEPALALPSLAACRLKGGAKESNLPSIAAVEAFIDERERVVEQLSDGTPPRSVDEVTALAERVVTKARSAVAFTVRGYVPGRFEFSRALTGHLLRRGVRITAVWSAEFTKLPPVIEHAAWLKAREVRPRITSSMPNQSVVVVDESVALVVDRTGRAVLERRPETIGALTADAYRMWASGSQLRDSMPVTPTRMSPQRYEQVLRMLADGLTDDAVARRLGVSVRTVRNDVASTMGALDACSRFQAGARAAQLGLI